MMSGLPVKMNIIKKIPLLALFASIIASAATKPDEPFVRKIYFAARADSPVTLDAKLDEPAWKSAAVLDDFGKSYDYNVPAFIPPAEVRVVWDESYLYVAAVVDEECEADIESFKKMADNPTIPLDKRDKIEVRFGDFCCLLGPNDRAVHRNGNYNFDFHLRVPYNSNNYGLGAGWDYAFRIDGLKWIVEARYSLADFQLDPVKNPETSFEVVRVRFGKHFFDRNKNNPSAGKTWQSYVWNGLHRDPTKPANYGMLRFVDKLPSADDAQAMQAKLNEHKPALNVEQDREKYLKIRDEILASKKVTEPVSISVPENAPPLDTEEPDNLFKPAERVLPFIKWGKPLAKRPKVFISISSWGSYDAWALTNRLDLDARIFKVSASPWNKALGPMGDEFSEGVWRYDMKRAELIRALDEGGKFDAYLFIGCGPDNWPADLQCRLYERVLDGAKLVVQNDMYEPQSIGTFTKVQGLGNSIPTDLVKYVVDLEKKPLTEIAVPANPEIKPLSGAKFGKGEVWTFDVGYLGGWVHRSEVSSGWAVMPDGLIADEYSFAYAVKCYMHALGLRGTRRMDRITKDLELETSGSSFDGRMCWTLHDNAGNVISTSAVERVEFSEGASRSKIDVGKLEPGRYTIDVMLYDASGNIADFAAASHRVSSTVGITFGNVSLEKSLLMTQDEPVIAICSTKGDVLRDDLNVRAEIRDVRNRILSRRNFPFAIGTNTVEIAMEQVRDYDWTCAYIDLTLFAGETRLDSRTFPFFRRREKLNDYTVFTGGPQCGGYMGAARLAMIQYYGIDLCQAGENATAIYYGSDTVLRDRIPGSRPEAGGTLTSPWYLDYCRRHFREDAESLKALNGRFLSLGDDSRVLWKFDSEVPDFVPPFREMRGLPLHSRRYKGWFEDMTNETDIAIIEDYLKAIRIAYPTVERFNCQCGTALNDWSELSATTLKTIKPSQKPEFCNFKIAMKDKYGDIAKLNAAWETSFTNFFEITEKSIEPDPKAKSYVPFIDAQIYREDAFVGQCKAISEGVRAVDPTIGLGFGATNLGNNQPEAMKYIDTVCPYAGISPAVEAGRALGAKFIGETMGMYGGRMIPKDFRERTVWHGIFNGSNFAWFWDSCFIGGDLSLNESRMGWMMEAIRDVKRGPAALCLRAKRQNDGIRVLMSRDSGHFNFLAGMRTNHEESGKAFYRLIETLGYQFDVISTEQVLNGGLKDAKVLVLPFAVSMSDKEAEIIRKFAADGGMVVADILPGEFTPDGQRRTPVLNELFGVTREGTGFKPAYRDIGLIRSAFIDDSVSAANGAKAFITNRYGKGSALLLNMNIASLPFMIGNDPVDKVYHHVADIFATGAGEPFCVMKEQNGTIVTGTEFSRFVRDGLIYLGVEKVPHLREDDDAYPRDVSIELKDRYHVYDVRDGKYLGKLKTIPMTLKRFHEGMYALLPYKVKSMNIKAPVQVAPGPFLEVEAAIEVSGIARDIGTHVFVVELIPPGGYGPDRFMTYPTRVLDAPGGKLKTSFPMAFNDPPGTIWTLRVTDAGTGISKECRIKEL